MTINNYHVLPMSHSAWHFAVFITVLEKGIEPGASGPTDEVCPEVTKHSLLNSERVV